ncbi:MAG: hypothetical protein ACJAUE_000838 [Alcanivorax sp.]|jgi:hypothetical protein
MSIRPQHDTYRHVAVFFVTFLLSNKLINAKALNEDRPEDEPVKEGVSA